MIFTTIVLISIAGILALVYRAKKRSAQKAFIENYEFNTAIGCKVRERYPHLAEPQTTLVLEALLEYFQICNQAGTRMVAMPSQVVDVAWHEFILFTRPYEAFCTAAFGRFLHHTPTEAMQSPTQAQGGIKRAWRITCDRSSISPSNPVHLPLLCAIDSELNIEDGFVYASNCLDKSSPVYASGYCAAHIGCASGCAGDNGSSSSSDGVGDGSGCGGGCGGG